VSSILDALRKIEDAESRAAARGAVPRPPRRTVPLVIAGIAFAFAAGVGAALWVRSALTPKPVEVAAAVPVAQPAPPAPNPTLPASPPVPPEPARVAAPAPTPATLPVEPPHVRAVEAPPAPPSPPPTIAPDEKIPDEPPRARALPAGPIAVAPPAREVPTAPEPPPVLARGTEPVEPPAARAPVEDVVPTEPPAGAPAVTVNFLAYSRVKDRRTVALTIGNAGMVTLREGETAGNVEVARILPDRVHLRYAGVLYAVKAVP